MIIALFITLGICMGSCLVFIYGFIQSEKKYNDLLERSIREGKNFEDLLRSISKSSIEKMKAEVGRQHPIMYDSYVESDEPPEMK